MKVFDDKHIKNVVFVGAHHCGKTTLSETMLFEAGLLKRRGTVEDKNTVSDYHEIEQERGASIYATPMHTEWRNYKINIIDTPGLDDFIGEIISSIRVGDTVVNVINARQGVEVGTEIIWNYIDKYHRPTLFVINQIDHPDAKFDESFNNIKGLVGNNAVKIQYPYILDGAQCIIDVLKMKCYKFGPEGGKPEKLEIPEDQKELADALHNELVEKAAERLATRKKTSTSISGEQHGVEKESTVCTTSQGVVNSAISVEGDLSRDNKNTKDSLVQNSKEVMAGDEVFSHHVDQEPSIMHYDRTTVLSAMVFGGVQLYKTTDYKFHYVGVVLSHSRFIEVQAKNTTLSGLF